ncbi:MAG: phenylacetate-CoA oxygenase subunit PaaI [Gemmatimonadetes bacterium]|nr:phenylacetate-CoA oxygenase subunit PaaI [Gemmatimonadota bacterium]
MAGEPVQSVDELDAPVREALRRHILTLADTKRLLGIRFSDWLLGAPSIETGIAASSMAQDEWGHARLLYAMLKDFGDDPVEVEHERPPEAYASLDVLDEELGDWADVVAAMVVVDGALATALEGFAEGRYEQARGRVPKMLAEEEFHRDLGHAWVRRLAAGTDASKARIGEAIAAMLPRTLAWLAPDDATFGRLVEAGLTASPDALERRFGESVASVLAHTDVDPGAVEADRSGWDETRGRGPGRPSTDAVERARGDRNRALFVE